MLTVAMRREFQETLVVILQFFIQLLCFRSSLGYNEIYILVGHSTVLGLKYLIRSKSYHPQQFILAQA